MAAKNISFDCYIRTSSVVYSICEDTDEISRRLSAVWCRFSILGGTTELMIVNKRHRQGFTRFTRFSCCQPAQGCSPVGSVTKPMRARPDEAAILMIFATSS